MTKPEPIGPLPHSVSGIAVSAYEHYAYVSGAVFVNGKLPTGVWVNPNHWGHPEIEIGFSDPGEEAAFLSLLKGENIPFRKTGCIY
jgi:hypothetical protein